MTLDQAVDTYYEPTVRMLARLTGSADTAADLAQTTFVGLAASWRPLESEEDHRRYVTRAAINTWRKAARNRADRQSAIEYSEIGRRYQPGPPEVLEHREWVARLHAAIMTLPDNQRAALTLIVFEKMSYDDVAELLDVPRDTVSKWRARAIKKLRTLMVDVPDRVSEAG